LNPYHKYIDIKGNALDTQLDARDNVIICDRQLSGRERATRP